MKFVETLTEVAMAARTPWLLVLLALCAVGARYLPAPERSRLRFAGMLIAAHVVTLVVAAAQSTLGYQHEGTLIAALAFELLALIAMGVILVFRLILPRIGLGLPRILVDIIAAVSTIVVLIAVGKRAGLSLTGLITTSAVLTAVIGFSLQDTLGNVMGGLALQLDNSVQIGDWISLGPNQPQGKVTEIRWRYTAIETRAWETIIIPNGVLMKSQVVIVGRRGGVETHKWRKQVDFFVDFRSPPTAVLEAVERAVLVDPIRGMANDPAPNVIFSGIRDSFAAFSVRYWLEDVATDEPVDSELRVRIWYALRRAGIGMAIPAQSLLVTTLAERDAKRASDETAARLAALEKIDLFAGLPAELRNRLADEMIAAPFARHEAVTREGDVGDDCLYVIVRGRASVRLGGVGGREVAELGPGDVFGEMSLMTGESRSATVVANTDLVCYRLDKPVFEALLHERPKIAEEVAGLLALRRDALTAAKESDAVRKRRLATEREDMLSRIRGFFGMRDDD